MPLRSLLDSGHIAYGSQMNNSLIIRDQRGLGQRIREKKSSSNSSGCVPCSLEIKEKNCPEYPCSFS